MYVEVVCDLYQIAEFHCNLNTSSLILPAILWTVTHNTLQIRTGEQTLFKEFQINCTEQNENVTVQCMVLDIANISSGIIYGDLITVRIQGKLTYDLHYLLIADLFLQDYLLK